MGCQKRSSFFCAVTVWLNIRRLCGVGIRERARNTKSSRHLPQLIGLRLITQSTTAFFFNTTSCQPSEHTIFLLKQPPLQLLVGGDNIDDCQHRSGRLWSNLRLRPKSRQKTGVHVATAQYVV